MGINNCIDIEKIIYQFFHELCHFIYYCLLYGIDKQFADEKEETICIKSLKREVYRNGFEDAQAVTKNEDSSEQYYVFKECLNLFTQLSKSLLDSHKEFDAAIKNESDKIIELTESIEKEIAIYKFNQAHYCLMLDKKAHEVLEELERIEKNNRTRNER